MKNGKCSRWRLAASRTTDIGAYAIAVTLFLVLMGAIGAPAWRIGLLAGGVLAICVPASRLVARIVEKKRHTFTVAGAFFTGVIATPILLAAESALVERWALPPLAIVPTLSAMLIAYVLGESVGRLACMSFGCCYGRPLDECPAWFRTLVGGRGFVFFGPTKKAVYEGRLAGQRLAPVQAVTAAILLVTALVCVLLYLAGWFRAALLIGLAVPQLWRWRSEFLRADYRGAGRISAYQVMALATIPYGLALVVLFGASEPPSVDLLAGIKLLWDPAVMLAVEALWMLLFWYTGRSEVTASTLSFYVRPERV
jgi:hypothetical protein